MKDKIIYTQVAVVVQGTLCSENCQFLRESGNGAMGAPERRECALFRKRLRLDWGDIGYEVTRCEMCLGLGQ